MNDKALITRTGSPGDLIVFDDRKRELIRTTLAKDLSAPEFDLFMAIASARGLDPVLNQIHAVKRQGKMVIQVGIDGFRLIASRTNEYAGSDEPYFELNDSGGPVSAKVTVYRIVAGHKCAFVGKALWDEFWPGEKQDFMWKKMPFNQLAKCAEAQALRKGFPGDLSGLYEPAELERERTEIDVTPLKEDRPSQFEDDGRTSAIKTALQKFAKLGVTEGEICRKFEVDVAIDLSEAQLTELNKIGGDLVNKRVKKEEVFSYENIKF